MTLSRPRRWRAAGSASCTLATVSATLPCHVQDVEGFFALCTFLRVARAPGQCVQPGVNQRGRATTVSLAAWADLWHDVWKEMDAWSGLGDHLGA